jgi:hypothetical protein
MFRTYIFKGNRANVNLRAIFRLQEVLQTVQPVEFCGQAGDVFFAHAWIIHSAGLHESDQVRCAVIQDINKVPDQILCFGKWPGNGSTACKNGY